MTKKNVETGATFSYRDNQYMLECNPEKPFTGKIFLLGSNMRPQEVGTFLWGIDPKIYVTGLILPEHPATVEIWKKECNYLGKI